MMILLIAILLAGYSSAAVIRTAPVPRISHLSQESLHELQRWVPWGLKTAAIGAIIFRVPMDPSVTWPMKLGVYAAIMAALVIRDGSRDVLEAASTLSEGFKESSVILGAEFKESSVILGAEFKEGAGRLAAGIAAGLASLGFFQMIGMIHSSQRRE